MDVVLLNENARMPERKSKDAAGFDLYAPVGGELRPGASTKIPLGFAMAPPPGYAGLIEARSGLADKYKLVPLGKVVDPDYRGEVCAMLLNAGNQVWEWKAGERICQMLLVFHYRGRVRRVLALDETERGERGWASTGL